MSRHSLALVPASVLVMILCASESTQAQKINSVLDNESRKTANAALQAALENQVSGRSQKWTSPSTQFSGRITPVRTWRSRTGHYCRAFVEVVRLPSGIERQSSGRACRTVAGKWVRI